jgi:hypothetical protein
MKDDALLADRVRRACVEALLHAYEDAGVQGLCAEGRWEAAVGAVRAMSTHALLAAAANGDPDSQTPDAKTA